MKYFITYEMPESCEEYLPDVDSILAECSFDALGVLKEVGQFFFKSGMDVLPKDNILSTRVQVEAALNELESNEFALEAEKQFREREAASGDDAYEREKERRLESA